MSFLISVFLNLSLMVFASTDPRCFIIFSHAASVENIGFSKGEINDITKQSSQFPLGHNPIFEVSDHEQLKSLIGYYQELRPGLTEKTLLAELELKTDTFPLYVPLRALLPSHVTTENYANDPLMNCHASAATFQESGAYSTYVIERGMTKTHDNRDALETVRRIYGRGVNVFNFESEIGKFEKVLLNMGTLKPGDSVNFYLPEAGPFGFSHEVTYLGRGMIYSKNGKDPASIIPLKKALENLVGLHPWIRVQFIAR